MRRHLSALSHLTELLQLARADSGIGASMTPIDVIGVVGLVAEDFSRMSEHAGKLELHLDGIAEDAACPAVDADALGIILRNLVENAFCMALKASLCVSRFPPKEL